MATYRYPLTLQLRSALSLLIWGLVLAGSVSYWMSGGPQETSGKIACGIFTVLLAIVVAALVERQIRLLTVVRTNDFGLTMERIGRGLSSIPWLQVDEVRTVGRLGGFEVRANGTGTAIQVEHTLSNAVELRTEVKAHTGL